MLVYVLRRILYIFFIVWIISILIFAITQLLPGNVAQMIMDQFATPESVKALEEKLGLNDPIWVQYQSWVKSLADGNLGMSLTTDQPIISLISTPIQRSGILAVFSLTIVAIFGISLGVISAIKRNGILDHAVSIFTYFGISVPEFFWGLVIMLLFSKYLGLLPASGYASMDDGFWQWISHLIAPVATLTFTLLAHVSRLTRSSMLEVLESNYVRVARAKGLPYSRIIYKHVLRNALLPTITVLALDFGWLIGGIVVVEEVFAFPGFGRLLLYGIQRHDLPLIQASIIIITVVYCKMNLLADLLYAYLDPRIRYANNR
jgi:peptide/nickel transport system permease protein